MIYLSVVLLRGARTPHMQQVFTDDILHFQWSLLNRKCGRVLELNSSIYWNFPSLTVS